MPNSKPTHIQTIEIKGLWSKYNIEWELHPEVNILAGANGTGKSTVLKLIAGVLTGGSFAKKVDEQIDEIEITLNNGKTVRVFSDTISNLLKRADEENQVRIALQELSQRASRDREVETRRNKKIGVFDLTSWEGVTCQNLRDCLPTISVVSTFDEPIRDLYKTIEFQAAPKEVETFLDFLIYKIQRAYLSYQINLGKKFERAILLEHEHLDAKRQREEIYSKKDLFYQTVNELFQETGKTIESDKQNEIAFRHGEQVLTPYQLSSGEKQVLLILLTVLIQDNQPSILLMDEPEISLHVDWQKRLIDDVRNLNNHAQVILVTHSPVVIMRGWMDRVVELTDLTRKV
jgi:predicted ATPase